MSLLLFLAVALAGGVGAAARLILDGLLREHLRTPFPWGTVIINFSGSLLLGLATGLTAQHLLPAAWLTILGTGFLGGYTTFSTASFETVRLLHDRKILPAVTNAALSIVGASAAAGLGLWAGAAL